VSEQNHPVRSSEYVKRNAVVVAEDPASASEDGGLDVNVEGKRGLEVGTGQEWEEYWVVRMATEFSKSWVRVAVGITPFRK